MRGSGLGVGVYADQDDVELVAERECDFAELLAAVQELVGKDVEMSSLGTRVAGCRGPLTVNAELRRAKELWRGNDAPVILELGSDVVLRLSPANITAARREEYEHRPSERHWILICIEFGPLWIEIEEMFFQREAC